MRISLIDFYFTLLCRVHLLGAVEGALGSFRLLGILPQFQGYCLGLRLLHHVERLMFEAGCCRALACIPSSRESIFRWIERRGYDIVGERPYPCEALGHKLLNDVTLLLWIKPLNHGDGTSIIADSKEKPALSLTSENTKLHLPPIWRESTGTQLATAASKNMRDINAVNSDVD